MRSLICAAGVSLTLLSWPTLASFAYDWFELTLTVGNTCTVTAPDDVDFGTVYNLNTEITSSTSFDFWCSYNLPFAIALDSTNTFNLSKGSNTIEYVAYTDSNHQISWNYLDRVTGTGTGQTKNKTIYLRILTDSGVVPPGTYSDTIKLEIEY